MSGQADDGTGVTRRTLLKGLAVSLPVLASGCRISLESEDEVLVDAGPTVDAGSNGAMICGGNLCIDLTNTQNAGLLNVGGSRVFTVAAPTNDKIMVVRETATKFQTLTAVCTHAGCSVKYVIASTGFTCPCHGSRFDLSGAVTNGPALRDLKTYTNDFDEPGSLVTINL